MTQQQLARRWPFYTGYSLTVAAGVALLWFLYRDFDFAAQNWWALGAFFLVHLLADGKLSESQQDGARVLSSKSLDLAAIVLFGPAPAAAIDALSSLLIGTVRRQAPAYKTVFNAAMQTMAIGLAGLVYHALPWSDNFAVPLFLVPLLAAVVVHGIVNSFVLAAIISLDSRVPVRTIYRRGYSWAQLTSLLDIPFGAILILLYLQAGVWTLLLFLVPNLVFFRSVRLFKQMKEAHINAIAALTTALEADEPYTHGHSYRVSKYALRIGRSLGMSENDLEVLEYGGLLHDIGKIAITNEIICKPGALTAEEFETMKTHPTIGADIVEQISLLREAGDLVRHHHERPDGKGYPHGLTEDKISLGCHILNVCDAYDAMTSDRPYRKALTDERAMEELVRNRGTQFLPLVVDTALKLYHQGKFNSINQTDGLGAAFRKVPAS